jgi:hypothetical protein
MSDSSKPATERSSEDRQLAEELVERARSEGVDHGVREAQRCGLARWGAFWRVGDGLDDSHMIVVLVGLSSEYRTVYVSADHRLEPQGHESACLAYDSFDHTRDNADCLAMLAFGDAAEPVDTQDIPLFVKAS